MYCSHVKLPSGTLRSSMAELRLHSVFWDVTLCGSCKNEDSEERIASIITVERINELRTT
jgi:hypothetical protein